MLRRSSPRRDGGAGAAEYAGLIVLAALILGALTALGIPSQVKTATSAAICRIFQEQNCGEPQAGGQNPGDPSPGDQPTNGNQKTGGQNPNGKAPSLADVQQNADNAQKAANDASGKYGNIKQQIIDLLKDFIGITDIEDCISKGSISACLWAAFDIASWIFAALKIAKFAKAVKDAIKLYKVFNKGRKIIDDAKIAAKAAKARLRQFVRGESRRCARAAVPNSFVPGRRVLLATGGTRAIEDIRVGDRVTAADPATGRTVAEPVTRRIVGHGRKHLVRLRVATGRYELNTDTVVATSNHPFWSARRRAWVPAGGLRPGDILGTRDGGTIRIIERHAFTQTRTVYNLSVARVHTYYVRLAGTAVLVHNEETCDAAYQGSLHLSEEIAKGNANHKIPGIDPDDVEGMEKYLDGWMKKTPDFKDSDGVEYWYDRDRGYMVLKKNEYSGTGRQMSPEEWNKFKQSKQGGG